MNNEQHENSIEKIVVAGGGTAGWMVAAALSKVLEDSGKKVTLVESEAIGTVGVGEATIPAIRHFNRILEINEDEFVKATNGTFKLGIQFVDWYKKGHSYYHPFGTFGTRIDRIAFQHHWQKLYNLNKAPDLDSFSLNTQACERNRFTRPVNIENSPLSEITYAFHFDASLYAAFLRRYAEAKGVKRVEGMIERVNLNAENGFIDSLQLTSGETISGDLFIDCTGFKALLIGDALGVGYENWSHYLPCDSAVAVGSTRLKELPPYTRATAKEAGWQWRIPLQNRTGNGYVYCSKYISDEQAKETLLNGIEGEVLGEPRVIRFTTGRRAKMWYKNCVAAGLSSGFLEPLESTSIHLIQSAISKLMDLFPTKECHPTIVEKFNAQLAYEYESIRDFLILHYQATLRDDSDFWRYCRAMEAPKTLTAKQELYVQSGRIFRDNYESFGAISWLAVMHGQGVLTRAYNPIADNIPVDELASRLQNVKDVIDRSCEAMPTHEEFIQRYCQSTDFVQGA